MYLELQNIRKVYDEKVAVAGLSLGVPKGVICGIIGPNGAGKTTTIRMIMNITAPDSGTILFDGKPVDGDFRNHVGYLPEERGLYKKMTLEEVIVYMAELKGYSKFRTLPQIDPWLSRLNLKEYRYKKVEELSKGMAQKLQFITTVLHGPEIIILDELFSGLDPLNMELMKNIILDLKREGKTILFSTHVMEQAEKLCDYICMISRGVKVIDGRLSEVKGKFGKNSVQVEFEGDGSFMNHLPGVLNVSAFNNYSELRLSPDADAKALLKMMVERVAISRFQIMEPSLFDIFIDMAKVDPSEVLQHPQGVAHV